MGAISDYVNFQTITGAAYPVVVSAIIICTIIFAWRSTEVTTDDDVRGQFTIPGRGTFNVINPSVRSAPTRTSNTNSSSGDDVTVTPQPEEETEYDAGDEDEGELNINVRYLDESVKSCTFRPSQSLGHFKQLNWTEPAERRRVCLIYAGKALRDDKIKMSRIGLKEGDTMHAFYRNVEEPSTNDNDESTSEERGNNPPEGDEFDELARYFLPLAGSLLVMTWFYVLSSPVVLSMSTVVALLFT